MTTRKRSMPRVHFSIIMMINVQLDHAMKLILEYFSLFCCSVYTKSIETDLKLSFWFLLLRTVNQIEGNQSQQINFSSHALFVDNVEGQCG